MDCWYFTRLATGIGIEPVSGGRLRSYLICAMNVFTSSPAHKPHSPSWKLNAQWYIDMLVNMYIHKYIASFKSCEKLCSLIPNTVSPRRSTQFVL